MSRAKWHIHRIEKMGRHTKLWMVNVVYTQFLDRVPAPAYRLAMRCYIFSRYVSDLLDLAELIWSHRHHVGLLYVSVLFLLKARPAYHIVLERLGQSQER